MVTDLEFDPPPLEVIADTEPLTVGVHVAVEVTCTDEWGFAVVTTTALAVAQYCKAWSEAADGNTKSLLVLSRLVTVTISKLAAELVVVTLQLLKLLLEGLL